MWVIPCWCRNDGVLYVPPVCTQPSWKNQGMHEQEHHFMKVLQHDHSFDYTCDTRSSPDFVGVSTKLGGSHQFEYFSGPGICRLN